MFNTLDLLLRYEARPNALRASRCPRSKLNGNIFFKLFLDLDEKITFAGYERHQKGNSETSLFCLKIYLPCRVSHENQKYSLPLDNFSLSSQQLVPNYFLYPSIGSGIYLQEILSWFSPNKHSSATCRHLAIVETRLKSWKRRTAENYSKSIEMLLTLNRLHFSWYYWLPKFLLSPYTCDGIKDAFLKHPQKWII